MKLYLSSYKLGNDPQKLVQLTPKGKILYISNALDFTKPNVGAISKHREQDVESLKELGLEVEVLDLRKYFGDKDGLREKMSSFGAVFLSGGNVFILRQAMKLSGMDEILLEMRTEDNFLYAGYSAAGCVLAPNMDCYKIVDDATETPYEVKEVIFDGLGILDFAIMPHYDSDHPESVDINKEVAYCIEHGISYKGIKDGDVIIMETNLGAPEKPPTEFNIPLK